MDAREIDVVYELGEDAEQTLSEKLYMFLYRAHSHHRSPELSQVFNMEFPFENIMNSSRVYLSDNEQEFANLVNANLNLLADERYIHPNDFSTEVLKRRINRCLEKFPKHAIRVEASCPIHLKKCRLLQYSFGFICYLHLLTEESEPPTIVLPESALQSDKEDVEAKITIDPKEERALGPIVISLSEESAVEITEMEESVQNDLGDLPLSSFPSFQMGEDSDFVLLSDIMRGLNIREDYCLAALSHLSEADRDFVKEEGDKHMLADSAMQDTEYKPGK